MDQLYQKRYRERNAEKLREYHRRYKQENREKIRKQNRKYKQENRTRIRETEKEWRRCNPEKVARYRAKREEERKHYLAFINRYKLYCGCRLCGFCEAAVALEFHHTNPENKKFDVSMGWCQSWKNAKAEIRKCVVVCSNCHRRVESGEILIPKE